MLPFTTRRFHLAIAAWLSVSIICCAVLLAGYWVFLVPIFQSPDEDYHADYVFSLYSKGGLIRGGGAPIAAFSHPVVFYLAEATNAQAVKYSQLVKMPKDYGSKQFFERLDRFAPSFNAQVHTNPVMMAVYPVGYYALTALWLGLISHFNHSLSFLFFGARLFSVILLACGLSFTYLTMSELGLPRWQSSLILGAISFFPLVSFVGSYIQSDNLSFALISACFFLALRWRNSFQPWALLALSIVLAMLLLTKYHFFCCVAIAVGAMIIAKAMLSRTPVRKTITIVTILLIPSVIAGLLQLWVSWGCSLPAIDNKHWHWFAVTTDFREALSRSVGALFLHISAALYDQYESMYLIDGQTFRSFWGCFGQCLTAPLVIASPQINDILRSIIEFATRIILLLTLASLVKVIISLLYLTRRGRLRRAIYIACSNPVVNCYFLFVLGMFLFNIIVYPSFQGLGRHWYPLILSILLGAACFAPRIFASRAIRQKIFLLIAGGWLFYSLISSYFALSCIEKRYYARTNKPGIDVRQLQSTSVSASYCIDNVDYIDPHPTFDRHLYYGKYFMRVPAGANVCLWGWAIDFPAGSVASAVLIYIDNKQILQADYGIESTEAVRDLRDAAYRFSGFEAIIPTKGMAAGTHTINIKVVSADGHMLYPTDRELKLAVK